MTQHLLQLLLSVFLSAVRICSVQAYCVAPKASGLVFTEAARKHKRGRPSRRRHAPSLRPFLFSSLFDDEDPNEDDDLNQEPGTPLDRPPARRRKFTGRDPASLGISGESSSPNRSVRERMQQREFNLVQRATSPASYLIQATAILALAIFMGYVGFTGQLGMGDYGGGEEVEPWFLHQQNTLQPPFDAATDAVVDGSSVFI